MSILEAGAAVVDPVLAVEPPAAVDPAQTAKLPDDPMADASNVLYPDGEKPEAKPAEKSAEQEPVERDPALPPEGETPEQKAAREAAETSEQKTAREAAEAKEAEKNKQPEGAPESYADFVVPEGVTLEPDSLKSFQEIAKADNLTQEQAQRYIDAASKMATAQAAAAAKQMDGIKEGWRSATTSDAEYGGDKLKESLVIAQKALKQFGSPELNELVVGAGLGDHPEFVRLMYRVGKAVSESPIVSGAKPANQSASAVLYPNLPQR